MTIILKEKKLSIQEKKKKKGWENICQICYFWMVLIQVIFTLFLSYH